MKYVVRQLHVGPQWVRIRGGFARRSQAEAWFLCEHAGKIVDRDLDTENDEISFMVQAQDGKLCQYVVYRDD